MEPSKKEMQNKKLWFLLCIVFGLHYLCCREDNDNRHD
jgi:hypothetical protein